MNIPDKNSLIAEYLTYGMNKEEATECAEYEINNRLWFKKYGNQYVKKILSEAKDYNRRMDAQKQLTEYQTAFKKSTYEKRTSGSGLGRRYNNAKPVTDPNGVYYKTTGEMCAAWKVSLSTYCKKRAKGWTMYQALTGNKYAR